MSQERAQAVIFGLAFGDSQSKHPQNYFSNIQQPLSISTETPAAVYGYLYQHNEQRLREIVQAPAAYLVKLALDAIPVTQYAARLMDFTHNDTLDLTILRIGHVMGWVNEKAALNHIGHRQSIEEVVALALYCVMRHPDDIAACVRLAAQTQGETAALAGAIMGARLGLDALPQEWLNRCPNRESMIEIAAKLAELR